MRIQVLGDFVGIFLQIRDCGTRSCKGDPVHNEEKKLNLPPLFKAPSILRAQGLTERG